MGKAQDEVIGEYDNYTFQRVEWTDLESIYAENRSRIFADGLPFSPQAVMSDSEKDTINRLSQSSQNNYRLNVGIYHQNSLVGWSFGWQDGAYRYYMTNTGILPAHQGKGVYSALLPCILQILTSEGFQLIYSRHLATDNRILVPKLKAGFVITSMELTDMFGLLLHLTWYSNPKRRKVLEFRAGALKPDDELKTLLEI